VPASFETPAFGGLLRMRAFGTISMTLMLRSARSARLEASFETPHFGGFLTRSL
jgi:hypothetical protein